MIGMPGSRRPRRMLRTSPVARVHVSSNTPLSQDSLNEIYRVVFAAIDNWDRDMQAIVDRSLEEDVVVMPKITPRQLERIAPLCGYRKSFSRNNDNKSCPICMRDFKPNRHVRRMPCNHVFCSSCISTWVCEENASCPVCRVEFTSSSPSPAD